MWWVLGGIALIIISVMVCIDAFDEDDVVTGVIEMIVGVLIFAVGLTLPFVPLMEDDNNQKDKMMRACQEIGGEYQMIDREMSGKVMVDVYGCVKNK